MKELFDKLKEYSIGFICITELEDHYTNCSHRIFLSSSDGIVTIYFGKKLLCKNKKFLDKIKNDDIIKEWL